MAVGYAVPDGVAGDIDALATSILAKSGITATDAFPLGVGDFNVAVIHVTGDTVAHVRGAIQKNALAIDLGGATGGTFTITVDGQTTSALNYNDNAATIETAVEALSSVTAATVTGAGTAGDPFLVVIDRADDTPAVAGVGNVQKVFPDVAFSVADSTTGGTGIDAITPVDNVDIFRGSTPA